MKSIYPSISLLLSVLIVISGSYAQDDFPELEGPYLGQKPPGLIPEVFAPNIVSTRQDELFNAFTPNLKEFYFVRYDENDQATTIVFTSEKNLWSESVVGPRVGEPTISPDGNTMHFGKRYMERIGTGWSEVKSLGSPFDDIPIMRLSVSSKGTYFFDKATREGNGSIRYSPLVDGIHQEPQLLSEIINSGRLTAHPFIAPDESYLIWDSEREGGYGGPDLYISFQKQDGTWGKAINLGDQINTEAGEGFASVTPDGKYLFFNRKVGPKDHDVFWVDAQFIETLRPKP